MKIELSSASIGVIVLDCGRERALALDGLHSGTLDMDAGVLRTKEEEGIRKNSTLHWDGDANDETNNLDLFF